MTRIFRTVPILLAILLATFSAAPGQRKGKDSKKPAKNSSPAAAIVNGERIPYDNYLEVYRDQSLQQGKLGEDTVVDMATADAIFLQLVDERLLHQEAAKRGIKFTEAQARQALVNDPPDFMRVPFTDEKGVFHQQIFKSVVMDPNQIVQFLGGTSNRDELIKKWKDDLSKVVRYVQNQELRRLVGESLYAQKPLTEQQIRHRYFAEKTTLIGSFIRVLHSTIPDSVVPYTEAECKAWYDSHQDDYRFSSARHVSTLILPVKALKSDSLARSTRLQSALIAIENAPLLKRLAVVDSIARNLPENRFDPDEAVSLAAVPQYARTALAGSKPGDLLGPFNFDREQVLIYVEGKAPTRDTVLRARHILVKPGDFVQDSLINILLVNLKNDSIKTEEDFIRSAKLYGQDGTALAGGDLGYFGRKVMINEFDNVVFNASPGEVVGPVITKFGQHLVWVSERITEGYRLRELRFPLEISSRAAESTLHEATRYAEALRANSTSQDSLLLDIKQRIPEAITDTSLVRQLEIYGDALGVTNFAFSAEPGDVAVIRLPFDRIAIVKLLQAWPAGVAPYEAIYENFLVPHVRRAKQMEMLKPRIDILRDSMTVEMALGFIRIHAPLAEAFMVQNQLVSSPPDEDPTLLDSLLAVAQPGTVTGPVRGKHGYYFLRVQDYTLRPREEDFAREREAYTKEYLGRYRDQLLTDLLKERREYSEVVDQRRESPIVLRQ